jgi:hypothetical protein
MKNLLKSVAVAIITLALTSVVHAQQGGQYQASSITNAQLTVLQGNIAKTNFVVYSAFTTSAARRYSQFTFQNVSTNPVVYAVSTTTASVFTNASTNAVYSAGGIRLAPAGTSGDRIMLNQTVPRNGPGNGGSLSFVFQVAPGVDPNATGLVNIEAQGF